VTAPAAPTITFPSLRKRLRAAGYRQRFIDDHLELDLEPEQHFPLAHAQ
jgi:hypothetical protein